VSPKTKKRSKKATEAELDLRTGEGVEAGRQLVTGHASAGIIELARKGTLPGSDGSSAWLEGFIMGLCFGAGMLMHAIEHNGVGMPTLIRAALEGIEEGHGQAVEHCQAMKEAHSQNGGEEEEGGNEPTCH